MPTKQGLRLHDHQSAAPLEQLRQHRQADSRRGVYPPRLHTALDEQRQLTAQEETLGTDSLARAERQHQPPESVFKQTSAILPR
jgi:hypothetical protein